MLTPTWGQSSRHCDLRREHETYWHLSRWLVKTFTNALSLWATSMNPGCLAAGMVCGCHQKKTAFLVSICSSPSKGEERLRSRCLPGILSLHDCHQYITSALGARLVVISQERDPVRKSMSRQAAGACARCVCSYLPTVHG